MDHSHSMRDFSVVKHARGDWNTKISRVHFAPLRRLYSFMSFKRELVEACADRCPDARLVFDIGCGTGAYSVWFIGRHPRTRVVSVDWSFNALHRFSARFAGSIMPVCADAQMLPFKPGCADAVISVDTLGHIPVPEKMLDETLRIMRPGAPAAIHSECADYRDRWPDTTLIARLGEDMPAQQDGHCSIMASAQVRSRLTQRFVVHRFYSPAGILGWLTGYPEKYLPAFKRASMHFPVVLCSLTAFVKKMPLAGALLRLFNICTNRAELFFGLSGGGSCFALITRPGDIEQ